jgi:hypothetical protein
MKKVKLVFADAEGNLTGKEQVVDLPTELDKQNQKTDNMDWDEDEDNAMQEYESLCIMSVDFADEVGFNKGVGSPWAEFRKLTDQDKADGVSMCIEIYDRDND